MRRGIDSRDTHARVGALETNVSDLARWREQDWRCLRCETPWDFELRPRLKRYASLIRSTLQGAERKRLAADGTIPTRQTRGLLIPRPVRVEHVTPIGKEVIVDPTDTDEGLTAEMFGATEVLEYHDQGERLESLRAQIMEAPESLAAIAREAKIDRRTLQRSVNQGVILHESTIDKLEAAVRRLRVANRRS
jgi:DNA-binding phage protein